MSDLSADGLIVLPPPAPISSNRTHHANLVREYSNDKRIFPSFLLFLIVYHRNDLQQAIQAN
jgi:hypothetical protein